MKKNIAYIILPIFFGAVLYAYMKDDSSNSLPIQSRVFDARNSTFKVENAPVTLVNGVAEIELASIPGKKITTRYFGNELKHDLDNDGREDTVFLVTQTGGGDETFFYVVAVLDTVNGYKGSDSYPLGDRIAPQSMNIDEGTTTKGTLRDNVIVVNYAIRNLTSSAQPSMGKSVWLKLDPATMQLGEVEQNFEG
jgi:hypothetical protein